MTRNRLRKLRRGVMVSLAGLAVSSTATVYAEETVPATAAPETTTVAPSAETVSEELLAEAKTQVDVAQGAVVADTETPAQPVKFETQWVSTREVGATAVSASNSVATPTYSRVAARQALPATGSRASYASLLAGLSSLTLAGLVWTRKRG